MVFIERDEIDRGDIHIVPFNDQVIHERSTDCVCGPTSTLIDVPKLLSSPSHWGLNPDGDSWQHTHHSLDGRERNVAFRPPSLPLKEANK